MDVNIDRMTSTVNVTDSSALLDPRVLEPLVALVLRRVREQLDHERAVGEEGRMRPGVARRESPHWE